MISSTLYFLSIQLNYHFPYPLFKSDCYYYYVVVVVVSSLKPFFSPDTSSLRLPVSDCSTFRITRDVPSTAIVCRELVEGFPGMASKFFSLLLIFCIIMSLLTR